MKLYIDDENDKVTETLQAENASLREQVEADLALITDYETRITDNEAQIESLQG